MNSIWGEGTDLSCAVSVFASKEAKIRKQVSKLVIDNPVRALELAESINDKELMAAITKTQKIGEKYKNYMPMQILQTLGGMASKAGSTTLLEDDVLDQIQQNMLVGFGYALPRKIDDTPLQIPSDIWTGSVNWRSNSVSGNGLSFVSVRLVENTKLISASPVNASETVKTDLPSVPLAPAKAGRKSRKEEILAAFEVLLAGGVLTKDTPKSILGHEVREFVLKGVSKVDRRESGLSDETIRRIIRSSK
jgi:hypothetical protein